jgi:hypothetical protein
MNKDCQPSPPLRKRRTVKRPPAHVTSQLEEKLDGLVTLLKSATQGAPGVISTAGFNSSQDGSIPSSHGSASGSTPASGVGYYDYAYNATLHNGGAVPDVQFTPETSSSSGSASVTLLPILHPTLEPSPDDAELYLNKFRADFVTHLPFITISPSMTARQLRQQSPFLWISIMSVASSNSAQQIALSREVRSIIGREAYVEGTRSIDLLFAILVYAGW